MRLASDAKAHPASMIKNGSIGPRNRGVSALKNTVPSTSRIGTSHSHRGARRAWAVIVPSKARIATIQNDTTPIRGR